MLDVVPDLGATGLLAVVTSLRAALPLALMLGGTPAPVPGSGEEEQAFDPADVTPGTVGFIATFAMVVAVIFLIRDMSRRIRRINVEARAREDEAAAAAAADAKASGDPSDPRSGGTPTAADAGDAQAVVPPVPASPTTRAGAGGRAGRKSEPPRGLRSIRPPVRDDTGDPGDPGDEHPPASSGSAAPLP